MSAQQSNERSRYEAMLRAVLPVLALGAGILLWDVTVRVKGIPAYILPSPGLIFSTLVDDWPILWSSLVVTLTTALQGLLLALAGGIGLAILFNRSRLVEYSLYPYAVILQVTPVVAIAPLLLIYLPLYNAIFFTYALVLTDFYGVRADHVGWYIMPFALGNFLGPILLGRLFDTLGRRPMIAFTYTISGLLLALTGYLFALGVLSAQSQTLCWMAIFFFASAAASSAYLTVAETFPLEVRAFAIAIFYAIGTGVGGILGPWLFGVLIESGSRVSVFGGYALAALLMVGAAFVAWRFGVPAERKALEEIARPLAFTD